MPLKESGEMYLETIYILCQSKPSVRSIDVAEYMNYSKPSISRGVGLLKQQGYILVDEDGYISLTESGIQAAHKVFERHTVLTNILTFLGVEKETAAEDACRMEHVISDESFQALKRYFGKEKLQGES
jgi:DtxR family Mn-dependent transcriptional regulator